MDIVSSLVQQQQKIDWVPLIPSGGDEYQFLSEFAAESFGVLQSTLYEGEKGTISTLGDKVAYMMPSSSFSSGRCETNSCVALWDAVSSFNASLSSQAE